MFKRTRRQLVGWNMLVLAVILVLVGSAVYYVDRRQLTSQVENDLLSRTRALQPQRGGRGDSDNGGLPESGPQGFNGGFFSLVLAPNGTVVSNPQGVDLTLKTAELQPPQFLTVTVNGAPARIYVTALPGPAGTTYLSIVGESLVQVESSLRHLLIGMLAGGGGGLILTFLGAWFLAGRALVPIELAFRRQQEFVADASHELRTPLTVLHATADLLDKHRDEPLAANQLLWDDFRHEVSRLERLATDLLMLARADLNQFDLAVAPVDLGVLSADVVRRTVPLAEARGIRLSIQPASQPLEAEVDPDRIQQVLLILLDNALKHTAPGGEVTVALRRHGAAAQLSVRDSGEGIAPEHLPRLFDRFYRVDRARSREQGGAGLGLPIARSIVTAHGGHLGIENTPGVGTTVTVELPLTETPAASLGNRLGRLTERVGHGAEGH